MKHFHSFEENRDENQEKTSDTLNLVGMQLKILGFFGVVLPEKFYMIVSLVIIFAHVLVSFLLMGAIVHYWGNIRMITEIMFEIFMVINAFILRIYLVYNRSELLLIFAMIDTHFMKFINISVSSSNRSTIIFKVKKQSKVFTYIFLAIVMIVILTWCIFPYIKKVADSAAGITVAEDDEQIHKYFPVITLLPKDVLKSPIYEIVYLYQVSCVVIVDGNFTACNIIFFFFMFYTAAHFELLLSCIEDIDIKFPEENNVEITSDNIYDSEALKSTNSLKKRQLRDLMEENLEQTDDKITRSLNGETVLANDNSATEKKRIEYLRECIKYHQAILEFSKRMNEFLSPMFLVYFLISEIVMCMAVFQVVVDESNGIIKFVAGIINVCFWPLFISWCGDYLIAKSKAVEEAVYACRWYNRSTEFKKLLHIKLMRAQHPVSCTAGKFFVVSLESFGDIVNKVYAYFTILKRMFTVEIDNFLTPMLFVFFPFIETVMCLSVFHLVLIVNRAYAYFTLLKEFYN